MPRRIALPDLIDAIVAAASALPALSEAGPDGWTISDGPEGSGTSKSTLFIGIDDPFATGPTPVGDFRIDPMTNRGRDEIGTINCYAEAWAGSKGTFPTIASAARAKCFAAVAAIEGLVYDQPFAIAIPNCPSLVLGISGGKLGQDFTNDGALALWLFQITYTARI